MAKPAFTGGSACLSYSVDCDLLFRSPVHAPVLNALQQTSPTRWLLENLPPSVGPPFFIISASNPLLQSWFSRLRHYPAVDPYFLFAVFSRSRKHPQITQIRSV